ASLCVAPVPGGREPVSLILRENNRFNDTLARLETAAPAEERALIQSIRGAQDDAMATVADIANAGRDRHARAPQAPGTHVPEDRDARRLARRRRGGPDGEPPGEHRGRPPEIA